MTDFSYEAVGAPRNATLASNADATALPYVPKNSSDGIHDYYDLGLCGPLRKDLATDSSLCGMFKTPTLRNVALTAPYFHNGVFKTLQDVMAFYNTRDTDPQSWYPTTANGVASKFDDIPTVDGGQFQVDINTPGSDLNYAGPVDVSELPYTQHIGQAPVMSADQVNAIIAFMCTLTDGYDPADPAAYTLTPQCQQAQSAIAVEQRRAAAIQAGLPLRASLMHNRWFMTASR
jgi:cytochrome c peroxidase